VRPKYFSKSEVTKLLKASPKLQNKSNDSHIYDIVRFCDNTSVTVKMAGPIMERSSSVKGNNVSKSNGCHSNGTCFKTMVIKHAEQTNVIQQANIASPMTNIQRWKQHRPELADSIRKF
jgi:hypothetical protein